MNRRQILAMAAGAIALRGQTKMQFEVASIKPSAPEPMGRFRVGISMAPGGRLTTTGTTAKMLIQQAYGVRDFQIVGGPSWLGTERYDITAKAEGAAASDDIKLMLQSLLADRFQLAFHRETKELPIYTLVIAKSGSRLKASEVKDEDDGGGRGGEGRGGRGGGRGGMMRMGRGQFTAEGVAITALANQLAQILGRSVIDKTELTGNFDIKLEWAPEGGDGHVEAPVDTPGASIFTAVQEQLGLKLEAAKGPVDILTIDHAERPSEN